MPAYIKLKDRTYPYTFDAFRKENNVSIRSMEDYANQNPNQTIYAKVEKVPQPDFEGYINEGAPEEYEAGKWRQTWVTVAYTDEQLAEELAIRKRSTLGMADEKAIEMRERRININGNQYTGELSDLVNFLSIASDEKAVRNLPLGFGNSLELTSAQVADLRTKIDDYFEDINDIVVAKYAAIAAETTIAGVKSHHAVIQDEANWPGTEFTV